MYIYVYIYIYIYIYIGESAAYFNLLLITLVGFCKNMLNFRYTNNIFTENLAQARLISDMQCCISLCVVSVRCSVPVNPISFPMVCGPLLGRVSSFSRLNDHTETNHTQ